MRLIRIAALSIISLFGFGLGQALAEKAYDTGASDAEIKIGNTAPYSGPASAVSAVAKTQAAFFKMINEKGGINGRKINFISYDDGYSPPKTVEQVRKLVESDEVLFLFATVGTPTNAAIHKYVNIKRIPHLFVAAGGSKWAQPQAFPWTMGWQPNPIAETRILAKYLLQNHPSAKIGVLYQNDDFGKDLLAGLKDALGEARGKAIVTEVSYEVTSPTIDSQIVQIKSAGVDVFMNFASPKFAAQAIRKIAELGWKPVQIVSSNSATIPGTMRPAGFENGQGVLSIHFLKNPQDPQWSNDPGLNAWREFMDKYYSEGDRNDLSTVYGYGQALTLVQLLKQCGDNLTRDNVMKQAANLDLDVGVTLPGIRIKTSPADFSPIKQEQMMRFSGENWQMFGPVLDGSAP
jgi:ABC-type branched-subunit amino acid transport system substrate-binding protein